MSEKSPLAKALDSLETESVPRFNKIIVNTQMKTAGIEELVSELIDWIICINTVIREYPEEIETSSRLRALSLLEWAINCVKNQCESMGLPASLSFALIPNS